MENLTSNPGLIADVVLLGILFVYAIIGARKGFVKSFLSTFGSFISLILAVLLCSTVANFLETKFSFITTVSEWVSGILTDLFGAEIMGMTLGEASNVSLTETNLSKWLIKIIIDVKGTGDLPDSTTISQVISPVFGYYVSCIVSVIGLYIIFKIIFFLIGEFTKALHKVALIGVVDKLLGFLFGVFKGIISLQIFIIVIRIAPIGFIQQFAVYLEGSSVAVFIDKINIASYIMQALTQVNLTEIIQSIISK